MVTYIYYRYKKTWRSCFCLESFEKCITSTSIESSSNIQFCRVCMYCTLSFQYILFHKFQIETCLLWISLLEVYSTITQISIDGLSRCTTLTYIHNNGWYHSFHCLYILKSQMGMIQNMKTNSCCKNL